MGKKTTGQRVRLTIAIDQGLNDVLEALGQRFDLAKALILERALMSYCMSDLEEAAEWGVEHEPAKESEEWHRARHCLSMLDSESIPRRLRYMTPGWTPKHLRELPPILAKAAGNGSEASLSIRQSDVEDLLAMLAEWRTRRAAA